MQQNNYIVKRISGKKEGKKHHSEKNTLKYESEFWIFKKRDNERLEAARPLLGNNKTR
jgi:hypothetical protein